MRIQEICAAAVLAASAVTACSPGGANQSGAGRSAGSIGGRWQGAASAFGAEAPLIVDFIEAGDSLRAQVTVDVEALWLDRPLANVRYRHPDVHFEFPDRNGNNGIFDGSRNGDVIEGSTTKSGRVLPMRFRRLTRDVPVRAVAFDTIPFRSADGTSLEGTLHRPLTPGPHAAVVFIHGSGPGTRDDFVYLADRFVRQGIAAFAYDKRGSGRSLGDATHGSFARLADDAEAAVAALAARPATIDSTRIAIAGLSEGGWVAPLVASRPASRVAGVIAVVAPGATYDANALYQNALRMRARNASDAQIAEYHRLAHLVNEHVRSRGTRDQALLQRALDSAHAAGWTVATDLPRRVPSGRELERMRWTQIDYDPAPLWQRVRAPTLVVLGGQDRNVNSIEAESLITSALRRGGNSDVTVIVFPTANHDLMVPPDSAGPFHFPTPPAGYPDTLASWLRAKVERRPPTPAPGSTLRPPPSTAP